MVSFSQSDDSDYEEDFDDFVFEGEGLTVIRNSEIQEVESGVSVALSKEQMDATARTGMVENVMSSVSTLPGMFQSP